MHTISSSTHTSSPSLLPTSDLPSLHCRSFAETLSTLKFAQRAKMIRNAAKPNELLPARPSRRCKQRSNACGRN